MFLGECARCSQQAMCQTGVQLLLLVGSAASWSCHYLSYVPLGSSDYVIATSSTPVSTVDKMWLARAFYNNSINHTGWDELEVTTNPALSDDDQAYQAGFLEAFLTQTSIYDHWQNTYHLVYTSNKQYQLIVNHLETTWRWMRANMQSKPSDPFWYQTRLIARQLDGMYSGYKHAVKANNNSQHILFSDLLLLNCLSDILTLEDYRANNTDHNNNRGGAVLVKLLPSYADVLFAHNTCRDYRYMRRVMKRYGLGVHVSADDRSLVAGRGAAFSSYPGLLSSSDNFYVLQSGIVVLSTELARYSDTRTSHTHQVFGSVRNTVANRLGANAETWCRYYAQFPSDTSNNQWLVMDLKQFSPGFHPKKDFMWTLEERNGRVAKRDVTQDLLAHGHWAACGLPSLQHPRRPSINRSESVRCQLLDVLESRVMDVESMLGVITYNNYKHDPYSSGNPCNSVSPRCDLRAESRFENHLLFGGIDGKVGSHELFSRGQVVSQSGPTTSHGAAPFRWSADSTDHRGQPTSFRFPPLTSSWTHPVPTDRHSEDVTEIFKLSDGGPRSLLHH